MVKIKHMKTLTISPQGQITIPVNLRRDLNLKGGTKLILNLVDWVKNKAIVLQPMPKNWVDTVSGSGKGLWGKSSVKYLEEERNSWQKT